MAVTVDDLTRALNEAGVDTPEKLTRFIALANLQVTRAALLTAADKARADGQAAHSAKNSEAAAIDAQAQAALEQITALISE